MTFTARDIEARENCTNSVAKGGDGGPMALKALKAKVRSDSVAEPVAVTATSSCGGGGSSAASSSRPPARNREFVRGCVARLKQIELRLDVGCGDEWFRRLDGVDDLAGLAQQLEQLRRLTNLEEDADSLGRRPARLPLRSYCGSFRAPIIHTYHLV